MPTGRYATATHRSGGLLGIVDIIDVCQALIGAEGG